MRKWQWREIIKTSNFTAELDGKFIINKVGEIVGQRYLRKNGEMSRGDEFWGVDQRFVTIVAHKFIERVNNTSQLRRYPYSGIRIERGDSVYTWNNKLNDTNFGKILDCHFFHAEIVRDQISKGMLWSFIKKLFDAEIVKFFERYFEDMFKIIPNNL